MIKKKSMKNLKAILFRLTYRSFKDFLSNSNFNEDRLIAFCIECT